jgi:hypothetical protein
MLLRDYVIDHSGFDWPSLVGDWAWLIPPTFTVWIMNRFGDLFIVLDEGTVHMLDLGLGTLEKVAENRDDFCTKLDQDDNAKQWLMIPLVDRLVASGLTLKAGQCYGYKIPPVMGGGYTVENSGVLPIREQFGVCASIQNQIKDLPEGTPVVLKVINLPGRGRSRKGR